jgi:hypothetical protein
MTISGYNTTRGDAPTGDNRPLLAMSTYSLSLDNYWDIEYFRCTKNGSGVVFKLDTQGRISNIKMAVSGTGSGSGLLQLGGAGGYITGCEVTSPDLNSLGSGIRLANDSSAIGNYAHDMGSQAGTRGIFLAGDVTVMFNTADTCPSGIVGTIAGALIQNNTVYNCTIGIQHTGGALRIYNNDINTCTTGISGDTDKDIVDFNNYYNNTADVSNVVKGANATANNPGYTDAANGDFENTLSTDDSAPLYMFGTNANKFVQGAWQPIGAGGGAVSWGY